MKISKKRLANKVRKLEVQNYDMRQKIKKMDKALTYLDELTTELNHALPDPEYDAKCEENAVAVEESLARHAVRLGLVKPKLKQLDQSVFDGEPEQIKWAVVTSEGAVLKFELEPVVKGGLWSWAHSNGCRQHALIGQYDTTNWQNSLIERKELTGSDLCRYIKSRKHWVLAVVSDENDATAEFHQTAAVVTSITNDGRFKCGDVTWRYAVPVDHKGETLTAKEVGL